MSTPIDQLKQMLTDFKNTQHKDKSIAEIKTLVEKLKPMDPATETSVYHLLYSNILDHDVRQKLLNDLNLEFDHNQEFLIKKIKEYLKNQLDEILASFNEIEQKAYKESEDYKNRMRVLDSLESVKEEANGECTGLSTLWAYGKRISDDPESENKKEKDDVALFYKNWKRLLLWDEKQKLSPVENSEIERFIANVRHYQIRFGGIAWAENTSGAQLDLTYSLSDTKRGSPVNSFDQKLTCDKDILKARLEKLILPKSMIFLGCETRHESGHMMSIYQDANKKIYFYDSNLSKGEILVHDIKQLSELIWQQTHPANFEKIGFDPLEDYLRKDLWIKIFRFKEDSEYQYPTAETIKPTTEEFLNLASQIPNFPIYSFRYQVKSLLESLDELQILEVLDQEKVTAELKMMLIENALFFRKNNTPIFARYIIQNHKELLDKISEKKKGLEDEKEYSEKLYKAKEEFESLSKQRIDAKLFFGSEEQIKYFEQRAEYIEKNYIENANVLSKVKNLLTLNEVLAILEKDNNIGNRLLSEELLQNCNQGTDTFFPLLLIIIDKNIKSGNLEFAKFITKKIKDRFNILISAKGIEDLGSTQYARFMHEEYGNEYRDRFGNPLLEYMPQIIHIQQILQKKKEVMDVMTQLMIQNREDRDKSTIEKFTNLALEIQSALTLNDALTILSVNPGNPELAENLLKNCKKTDEKLFSFYLALHENIQNSSLSTAKVIINILAKQLGTLPTLKAIEDLDNEELATFMHENYGSTYLDKNGNSELTFMANKININRESRQKRITIMHNIDQLLEIDSSRREKKELDSSIRLAIENQKLLTPTDILKVLLLNLGNNELANELFTNCIARDPANDFYIDRELLIRVLNENIKIGKPQVSETLIHIYSQRYNLKQLLWSSRKELDPKVYSLIEKLLSDKEELENKADRESKMAIEKEQALHAEQVKTEQRVLHTMRDLNQSHSLFQVRFDYVLHEMEDQVSSSLRMMEITQNDISSRLKSFQPLMNSNELKEKIKDVYTFATQFMQDEKQQVEKRLSSFQEEASDRLKSLDVLSATPIMFSKKLEIDLLIQDIKSKMLEIEEASRRSLAELQSIETKMFKAKDETLNEIDYQIKICDDSKNEIRQLIESNICDFDKISSNIKKILDIGQKKLEDRRLGIADNILNGIENSLQYALSIRTIVDEEESAFLSERQRVEMIEKHTLQKMKEMFDAGHIDIEFFANCMTLIREKKKEVDQVINVAENASNVFSSKVFEELREASKTRDQKQFKEQMLLHASRMEIELKAEMEKKLAIEKADSLQQEIKYAMKKVTSTRTWLQDHAETIPHRMNNELTYIRDGLEIIKDSITFTLNSFDSLSDSNYQKESIQRSFDQSMKELNDGKEVLKKSILDFSYEMSNRLKILNELSAKPQFSSIKSEIDQVIGDVKVKALEVEKNSDDYFAKLKAFEVEMTQVRDQAFNEIDRRVETGTLTTGVSKKKLIFTKYNDGQKGQQSQEEDYNTSLDPKKPNR